MNSIADTAALELDLRSESEAALQALESSVRSLLDDLKPGNARIQLEQIGHRPGGALPREHPLVKAGIQAYRDEGEKSVRLEVASTDASFPLSLGLPAICVGLTRGGEAHSVREYIEIDPLPRGYTALLRLIQAAFRLGPE